LYGLLALPAHPPIATSWGAHDSAILCTTYDGSWQYPTCLAAMDFVLRFQCVCPCMCKVRQAGRHIPRAHLLDSSSMNLLTCCSLFTVVNRRSMGASGDESAFLFVQELFLDRGAILLGLRDLAAEHTAER
jgi:hypothetical protein